MDGTVGAVSDHDGVGHVCPALFAPLAQLVELRTFNP